MGNTRTQNITDAEKEKWWKLRNGDPPVLAKELAIRFGASRAYISGYLKRRAERENVNLPASQNTVSMRIRLGYRPDGPS